MTVHFVLPIISARWSDCIAAPVNKAIPAWESFIALVDVCSHGLGADDIELAMYNGLIYEARRRIRSLVHKEPS